MRLIADYLLQSDLEVVGLQEVWIRKDYEEMAQKLKEKFPYSYSFKWYTSKTHMFTYLIVV